MNNPWLIFYDNLLLSSPNEPASLNHSKGFHLPIRGGSWRAQTLRESTDFRTCLMVRWAEEMIRLIPHRRQQFSGMQKLSVQLYYCLTKGIFTYTKEASACTSALTWGHNLTSEIFMQKVCLLQEWANSIPYPPKASPYNSIRQRSPEAETETEIPEPGVYFRTKEGQEVRQEKGEQLIKGTVLAGSLWVIGV